MSLRLRLALLYTVVLSVTLVLSGIILVVVLRRTLVSEVDRSLVALAQEFDAQRWLRGDHGGATVLTTGEATVETFTEVFDRQHVRVAYSPNLQRNALHVDDATLDDALTGVPRFVNLRRGGAALRTYVAPVLVGGRMRGAVVVARSLGPIPRTLATVWRTLLRIDLVLIAIALISGLVLARAALRPIDRITRTAAAIGEGLELDRRIDYRGPDDEVGRLAVTVNTMLDRVATAYRQQQDALEAQQRFVADASHDLRTPITSITGNVQFLLRAKSLPPDEHNAVLHDIGASAGRMQHLVSNLLALARVDAGQLQLRSDTIFVNDLLEGVAHEARALQSGVAVIVELAPGLALQGDAESLHRVLMILVENALKHTAPGGRVRLAARQQNTHIRLDVSDTGTGIAPEHLPHIFERFYRADTARSGAGTGLGLSIAQATIAAMGGSIVVQSTAGVGTSFSIELAGTTRQTDSAQAASAPASYATARLISQSEAQNLH